MAVSLSSIPKRIHKTFANLRTGIVLLILVVITSAMGTFVLEARMTGSCTITSGFSCSTTTADLPLSSYACPGLGTDFRCLLRTAHCSERRDTASLISACVL
jgi:hypothetical protein